MSHPIPDAETLEFLQSVFELVRSGDAEQLGTLLGQGLPANLLNQKGDSLLMLATYNGHLEATRVLLAHGADPELINDRGQTPLMAAAFKGDMQVAELLLKRGAHTETAGPAGKTALTLAAMFNRTEMVDLLLAHHANLHVRDVDGLSVADAARVMGAEQTRLQLEDLLSAAPSTLPL